MTAIDPERWRRLEPILNEVLTLSPDERDEWLDRACAGDAGLRRDIERMLRADAEPGGLLDMPSAVFLDAVIRDVEDERRSANPALAKSITASPGGELLSGTILSGRYRIVGLLGRGGMGEVYRADDLKLRQTVALKFVSEQLQRRPDYLPRLMTEARLARQVSHPNVCRVYDIGEADGRHFLSMEYVDGEDLASLLKRIGQLAQSKALDIGRQLCAGLDAAHRQGILHRDLKPANVILDGRGQVRITDFGLAVATAHLEGAEVRAGTPAYMAPEQLGGREATVRSDLYALGLLLYELFTGRRPFQALDGASRPSEDSSPPPPSQLIEGFNPIIERTILSCLESDPMLRPPSAAAVAAALPGGDAISAALAAGVTPLPDVLAASGPHGGLAPATAFGVAGATLVLLAVLVVLSDRASILGWVPITRSPDALEDNARGILQRLGYDASPIDRTADFDFFNRPFEDFVRAHDTTADRWAALREPGQIASYFFYRQASRYLRPLGSGGEVGALDPPPAAGDVMMTTDLRGRLIWLQAQPEDASRPTDQSQSQEFDWSRLFAEAGLDLSRFRPVQPTRNPPVTTDARAAWTGVLRDFNEYPVRVEAASHRSKPVFFELVVPWDAYWDPAAAPVRRNPTRLAPMWYFILILFGFGTAGFLVVRNWRNGRGDRRGGFRLAVVVFCLRLAVWIVGGHHVPAFREAMQMMVIAIGASLMDGAALWCFYIALEPHARRLFPRHLVSWTRLLRGRVRDPLVGRDVLYGVALAIIAILCWEQLYVLIPHALELHSPPPPAPHAIGPLPYSVFWHPPPTRAILGGRYVLEALSGEALIAIGYAVSLSVFLLGLRIMLRNDRATGVTFVAVFSLLGWPSDFSAFHPIGLACTAVGALAMLWAFRIGMVSSLVLWFCVGLWLSFPITAKIDAPHFAIGLVGVLTIAALAVYGAVTAARSRLRILSTFVERHREAGVP